MKHVCSVHPIRFTQVPREMRKLVSYSVEMVSHSSYLRKTLPIFSGNAIIVKKTHYLLCIAYIYSTAIFLNILKSKNCVILLGGKNFSLRSPPIGKSINIPWGKYVF